MNERLDFFRERSYQNRFVWFRQNHYLPQIYRTLSDWEFEVLVKFFLETEEKNYIGEASIPIMSEMIGFIDGSGLDGVIQLGHYAGWSTLMLGWALRRMEKKHSLFSIDIDVEVTAFAQKFIGLAGLEDYVRLTVGDSADPDMLGLAIPWIDQQPNLIFIDSSHQYAHTLRELNLWYPHLQKGGLMFLHDISTYAKSFDTTEEGGVHDALEEWTQTEELNVILLNGDTTIDHHLIRQDGCGAGIIQK